MFSTALAACNNTTNSEGNHDINTFHVMFLSEIPEEYDQKIADNIHGLLSDELDSSIDIKVDVMIPSYDKLVVEILNKEVDLFVVDQRLEEILLDPYGLEALVELELVISESAYYEDYFLESEEDGAEHLYAVPFDQTSQLQADLAIEMEELMVAGIVRTSPHKELSLRLLEYWL